MFPRATANCLSTRNGKTQQSGKAGVLSIIMVRELGAVGDTTLTTWIKSWMCGWQIEWERGAKLTGMCATPGATLKIDTQMEPSTVSPQVGARLNLLGGDPTGDLLGRNPLGTPNALNSDPS